MDSERTSVQQGRDAGGGDVTAAAAEDLGAGGGGGGKHGGEAAHRAAALEALSVRPTRRLLHQAYHRTAAHARTRTASQAHGARQGIGNGDAINACTSTAHGGALSAAQRAAQ
jgi:hypothetical protein